MSVTPSKKLVNQLEIASGLTQQVIIVIFDIRGFTNFCRSEDSYNIANYVKRIYIKILSNYFDDADYYKPTGDGLLMVFNCPAGKEEELSQSIVNRSMKLVDEFNILCKGDLRVYFKTPRNCGIGISRGCACRIFYDNEIIDYSGKPLNLASRLSDMARPLGVVFDESISSCLKNLNNFKNDNVYVKGLAETEPILVYSTQSTVIPSIFKRPFTEPEWRTDLYKITAHQLKNLTGINFEYDLQKNPFDVSQMILKLTYPSITTGYETSITWNMNENVNVIYVKEGSRHKVRFNRSYIISFLDKASVPPEAEIKLEYIYPVKDS